ncbi:MAG: methyltransferase [Flavobacteriaceae bacterium]|nr:methyltransferase [Flavobacteriaceae bacterium]
MLKAFHFKQFSILQNSEVFRVGTDGVLLGAIASCQNALNTLEIGTGTGLISLMIAQRNPESKILAIDINENAVKLAEENFQNSPFENRIFAKNIDFKEFKNHDFFDFIVCNPPFFEENNSQKDILARQQISLNFEQLILNSAKILTKTGVFSVIIPKYEEEKFTQLCEKVHLILFRKIEIKGNANSDVKRCILEFSFERRVFHQELLVLETSPRVYSPEYLELTKDFHLFRK